MEGRGGALHADRRIIKRRYPFGASFALTEDWIDDSPLPQRGLNRISFCPASGSPPQSRTLNDMALAYPLSMQIYSGRKFPPVEAQLATIAASRIHQCRDLRSALR